MRGSFAPVEFEVHSKELEVLEGALPEGLEGAYVRTGGCPAGASPGALPRLLSAARQQLQLCTVLLLRILQVTSASCVHWWPWLPATPAGLCTQQAAVRTAPPNTPATIPAPTHTTLRCAAPCRPQPQARALRRNPLV